MGLQHASDLHFAFAQRMKENPLKGASPDQHYAKRSYWLQVESIWSKRDCSTGNMVVPKTK